MSSGLNFGTPAISDAGRCDKSRREPRRRCGRRYRPPRAEIELAIRTLIKKTADYAGSIAGLIMALLVVPCAGSVMHAQNGEQDGVQRFADLGQCTLESGQVVQACRIGYRTFGTLDAKADNAVVFLAWYGGTSGDLRQFFGPDHMVDTTRFFGVAIDPFGDGVSPSPSNSAAQHGADFPKFTVRDMVRAEYRAATEVLHLHHLHAVAGMSMGGFQVFPWTALYPEFMDLAIPLVGSPQLTSYDLLNLTTLLDVLVSDPGYHEGRYTQQPAMTLANELYALTLTSPGYRVEHTTPAQFPAFLQASRNGKYPDANDRIWQLRAILTQDVLGGKDLATVAKEATPRFFVVSSAQDHLVDPEPALAWAKASGSPTYVSTSNAGHIAYFEADRKVIDERVRSFLAGAHD